MKNLRISLLTAALLAAMTLGAAAQTKTATVDMKKLFSGYWKTQQSQSVLENQKAKLKREIRDMASGLDKEQANYKQLLDQASDQAISQDERDKRKQSAIDKLKEMNNSKASIEQYQRQGEAQLQEQSQRMSGNLVAEIQKQVGEKAKAGGYTLVLNSATPEIVVFSDTSIDITESVLKQLNVGAPIDVTKPAGGLPLTISTNLP